MWPRLLGVVIFAAGCRAQPCSSEVAAPAACTLTRDGALARAGVYLAETSGSPAAPPEFIPAGPCRSHCARGTGRGHASQDSDTCASWECPYWYGPPGKGTRYTHAYLEVHVIGCGARAFTGLRLAACFARPHRCAARVDRDAALAIAGSLSPSHDEMFLRWSARAEQFEWVVGQWQGGVYREVMRIGAHAPAKPERPRERR